jgi:DNA-binding response OmpR family regulator
MRILTIEDDDAVGSALQESLRSSYVVDRAATGAEGLTKVKASRYDVVVLDLHLPDMAGLEVCTAIKAIQPETPILILSGDKTVLNKITLLDAGAEDYLTKPFSLGELKARLRAIVRRKSAKKTTARHLVVDDLRMDINKRLVTRNGQNITLRRKEFALLECLMAHAGTVVTRDVLTSYAWSESEDMWTNTVDVHIKSLRDKIDRPFGRPLINTVHGLGYRIEPYLEPSEK